MDPFGIISQVRTAFVDRGRLKVKADVIVQHTDHLAIVLRVTAINVGRRPLRIKKVVALLDTSQLPIPAGVTPEVRAQIEQLQAGLKGHLVEHSLPLFDGEHENDSIELSPDGGDYTWSRPIGEGMKFLSERKRSREYGNGYILFTSGKKVPFRFLLLSPDNWPPFASSSIEKTDF